MFRRSRFPRRAYKAAGRGTDEFGLSSRYSGARTKAAKRSLCSLAGLKPSPYIGWDAAFGAWACLDKSFDREIVELDPCAVRSVSLRIP